MDGYQFKKTDAAACLAAALLDGLYHHYDDEMQITQKLVTELCERFADESTSKVAVLQELVDATEESFFAVVHWLYGWIERSGMTAPELFVLLGRYGGKGTADGHFELTKPGDAPPFFSTI